MNEWPRLVYNHVRKPSIKLVSSLGVTSKQLTLFNHLLTLSLGCYAFAQGTYWWGLAGLAVCLLNGFLDYLDGDMAKETNTLSKFGAWLDSGFDVIIQNAVMAAIAMGCVKMGMPLFWAMLFMVANSANNLVSFHYNQTFGFDSDKGNELFRNFMSRRQGVVNIFFKALIDPTESYWALVVFTYRYWIAVGIILNIMPILFVIITIISNVKWFIMYCIYAMHLRGDGNLFVLQALAVLDEERNEFYRVRSSQSV